MTELANKLSFDHQTRRLLEDLEDTLLGRRVRKSGRGILQAMQAVLSEIAETANEYGEQPTVDYSSSLSQALELLNRGEIEVSGNAISLIFDCSNHMKSLMKCAVEGRQPDALLLAEGEFLMVQFLGLKNGVH